MDPKVDNFLMEGCGRCSLGGTPECKVHHWPDELVKLRSILTESQLDEEVKWGFPCYTYQNKNIVMIYAFKDYCSLSFFKGVLLRDPNHLLQQPGENTQSARVIKFTNMQQILEVETILQDYISEAIEVEKSGLQVEKKKTSDYDIPEEFQKKLDEIPELKTAFESLTPGRQRGYLLYFSQPKRSQTRESRVEKYMQKIMDGQGLHDR